MIPLHSIMAMAGGGAIPALLKTLGVIVLLLSFAVGFVKGFRRVSWGGLAWAIAGVAFVVIGRALPSNVNFVIVLLIAMAVIVATCVFFGVLGHYLRPKMRWVKDDVNGDTSLAEFGLEFEPEYIDYDGEHEYAPYGKRLHKTGFGPPCFFFRLVGGLTCLVNAALIMWVAYSLLILTVGSTGLHTSSLGVLLQGEVAEKLIRVAKGSTFELLTIGIMMGVAVKGYKKGMLSSIHALLLSFGGVVAFGVSFYLPFSPYASATGGMFVILGKLVARCCNALAGVSMFGGILGRLLAGLCIFIVAMLILWMIDIILRKCCNVVEGWTPTRVMDSTVAFMLYLFIGALICIAIWFVLAAADYFGIFQISEVLNTNNMLTGKILDFAKVLLDGFLTPYIQ